MKSITQKTKPKMLVVRYPRESCFSFYNYFKNFSISYIVASQTPFKLTVSPIAKNVIFHSLRYKPALGIDPLQFMEQNVSNLSWQDLRGIEEYVKSADIINLSDTYYFFNRQIASLAKKYNKPVVTIIWTSIPHHISTWLPPYSFNTQSVLHAADFYILRSKKAYLFTDSLGIDRKKTVQIYKGVDINHFRPRPKESSKTVTILYVGQYIEAKGIRELLWAFEKLVKKGLPVRLIMAGKGPLQHVINEKKKNLPITDYGFVRFDQLPQIYNQGDIFCSPSQYIYHFGIKITEDYFPYTLMEAQASGLPVIVSKMAGIPEGLDHANYLVEPGNKESLFQSLQELVNNKQKRDYLSTINRKFAENHFNAQVQAQKTEEAILRYFPYLTANTNKNSFLLIQPWLSYRGAERVSIEQAYYLQKLGYKTKIAAIYIDREKISEHIKDIECIVPPHFYSNLCKNSKLFLFILGPVLLLVLVLRNARSFTILNPHNLPSVWVAVIAGKLFRKKVIWTAHNIPQKIAWKDRKNLFDYFVWFFGSSIIDIFAVRKVDLIISPSRMVTKGVELRYRKKSLIIPNGIEPVKTNSMFLPERIKKLREKTSLLLLQVGVLHHQKGQIISLLLLKKLRENNIDAGLIFIGDGPDKMLLKRKVKELDLNDSVFFTGFIPNSKMYSYYNICDLNLLPSTNESFSGVILESLMQGKTSIVTDQAGILEVVSPYVLVAKPTEKDFYNKTYEFLLHKKDYEKKGKDGQRYLLKHLTWGNYCNTFAAKANDLLFKNS